MLSTTVKMHDTTLEKAVSSLEIWFDSYNLQNQSAKIILPTYSLLLPMYSLLLCRFMTLLVIGLRIIPSLGRKLSLKLKQELNYKKLYISYVKVRQSKNEILKW